MSLKRLWARLACALVGLACPAFAGAMQHAFLVQNSGWMEPFYADSASQLKPLVAAVANAVTDGSDEVVIQAFNQRTPTNPSPVTLYQGRGAGNAQAALAPLGVALKAPGGAMADTDFKEAVISTITGPFKAQPGIVWIFTNNRNSPNNDAQTTERNREFYRLVHLEPSIARTLAFPLRMPVQGKHYRATGLMVYALAYGEPAAQHLQALVEQGRLARVFTAAPARLKPLDQDGLRVVPREVRNSADVQASLAADGRTLVFDIEAAALAPRIGLRAGFENLFFPYEIVNAEVRADMVAAGGARLPLQVAPARLSGLAPGAATEVELQLPVPVAQVPSPWSAAAISAMGKRVLVPAMVEVSLAGQQLRISEGFRQSLSELFPGDPLSEVFLPPEGLKASTAHIPVLLRIQYPLLPVVVVVGGLLALVLGLAALALLAGRSARYDVTVDGFKRTVALKAFGSLELRDPEGNRAGSIKRGLGAPSVVEVAEGHSITIGKR